MLDDAPELLVQRGFERYALLTTARARPLAEHLVTEAMLVIEIEAGAVPELAAAARGDVAGRPLVALGGGRVVDVAKAVAGAEGVVCAAIPTTLAGSPMTPFHRLPSDASGGRLVRPSLVIADPALMASAPQPLLAATAMNGLAHAFESLYTPLANPVARSAALRAASGFAAGLAGPDAPDAEQLALAAVLAGYAVGTTGFAVHHATCQTIVRMLSTPHAQTNAVMLPHTVAFMADRAPEAVGEFAAALGAGAEPHAAAPAVAALAAHAGPTTLGELGVRQQWSEHVAKAVAEHPALGNTPPSKPTRDDIEALVRAAS